MLLMKLMKVIKIQMSRLFFNQMQLEDLFEDIERLEIINTYQYDPKNFFSMQRIKFSAGIIEHLDSIHLKQYLQTKFSAIFLEIIEKSECSILCIMKQRREFGSWYMFDAGPLGLLFPIVVNCESVLLSFIIQNEYLDQVKEELEQMTKNIGGIKVLAQNSIDPKMALGLNSILLPKLTVRQQEIASFATRKGFFKSPKQIAAKEIAAKFLITESAVNHHLRKVQKFLMETYFGTQDGR